MAVLGSSGSAVLVNEQEKLDFDSVPEYIREPRLSSRDSYTTKSYLLEEEVVEPLAKSAEIETLWPGISADFLHGSQHRKQPAFYWSIGFVSGIVVTVLTAGLVSTGLKLFNSSEHHSGPQIVITGGTKSPLPSDKNLIGSAQGALVTTRLSHSSNSEIIVPMYPNYTVKNGDTLASIAMQAYKRATPRLLDEICKANGMRNANVLSMGQTLTLPEYRPPARQIASGASNSVQ